MGKSALAVLAFLGAGHTQRGATAHAAVVARGLAWLVAQQDARTGHFGETSAYGHGIATYALAEAYALTGDEALRAPLERAVAEVLRHQDGRRGDARRFGGWSYYYADGHRYDDWPRASITAWQVMALRSAQLGGVAVPEAALADARAFLLAALDTQRGAFRYSHDPTRLAGEYAVLPGSTPAALFALHLLGEDLADERFAAPLRFVLERAPRGYVAPDERAFVAEAAGNLYFWYYGSLALLQRGGASWRRWNAALQETLLGAQRDDGSWRPLSPYARYADDAPRDAIYTTAMNVLSLEVYYRYFTPLLEAATRGEAPR
ncbi:MAG: hypothetical protein H6828_15840 [Planctomycetes bacterium]|nr:hypothetical protein [Planctomycetota bacterium]